jgi:hypothetical protein
MALSRELCELPLPMTPTGAARFAPDSPDAENFHFEDDPDLAEFIRSMADAARSPILRVRKNEADVESDDEDQISVHLRQIEYLQRENNRLQREMHKWKQTAEKSSAIQNSNLEALTEFNALRHATEVRCLQLLTLTICHRIESP